MSLILEANQICPHRTNCPYNDCNTCLGGDQDRLTRFECDYIENGVFIEGGVQRSRLDQTGKMKIIME